MNVEIQTLNAPHALNAANTFLEKNLPESIKERHALKESSHIAGVAARVFSEHNINNNYGPEDGFLCGLKDNGPMVQMGQEGNISGLGNAGPTYQVGQGENTLLSFDQACRKLNGPHKRNKKAVKDL